MIFWIARGRCSKILIYINALPVPMSQKVFRRSIYIRKIRCFYNFSKKYDFASKLAFWGASWLDFGTILAPFLAPSWVTLGAFGHPMGTFGTLWGAFGTPFRSLDPSWRLLQSLMSSLGRFLTRFRTFYEVYSVCSIKITSLSQSPRCGNIRHARNPHHKTWPRLRRRRGRGPHKMHRRVCNTLGLF